MTPGWCRRRGRAKPRHCWARGYPDAPLPQRCRALALLGAALLVATDPCIAWGSRPRCTALPGVIRPRATHGEPLRGWIISFPQILPRGQDVCRAKLNLESENEYVEHRNRNNPKHIIGTLWVITPIRQRLAASRKRTLRRRSRGRHEPERSGDSQPQAARRASVARQPYGAGAEAV
jgi:hypothetical protein